MSGYIGTAWIEVKANLDKFSRDVSKSLDGLSTKLTNAGKGLTKGLTTPIVGFFGVALNEAFDAQKVAAQTEQTLKSTGNAAVISADQINAMSDSIGKMVVQDNDAVKATANLILNMTDFTKFGENADEVLAAITETSYNYAAATGVSAESASKLFTTLANDPTKAIPRLVKLGVITKEQGEAYKEQIEAGEGAKVSQELLGKAQDRYAKAAKRAAGPLDKLKVTFADIAEQVGTILLPIAEKFLGWLESAAEWFKNLSPEAKTLATTILGIAAALGPILIVAGKVTGGLSKIIEFGPKLVGVFKAVGTAIGGVFKVLMANPIILIIAAIILVAILIYKNWDTIKKFLLKIWDALKSAWETVWNAIKGVAFAVWDAIKGAWNGAIEWFSNLFNNIKERAIRIFNGIKDFVTGIWDAIVGGIKSAINLVIDGVNVVIRGVNFLNPFDDIPEIPHLAKGGIVTGPTVALVGEAGAEAVIPLSQLNSMMGSGVLRITDWRRGLATLERELDYNALARGD